MFGIRLKALRRAKGVTQEQLAKIIGVERSSIGKYEGKDQITPSFEVLKKMSEYFGVSVDYLLGVESAASTPGIGIRAPVLGSIPAGVPIEAIEDIEDWEELPARMARGGQEYFALRIHGDSMAPRYAEGDVVIFRKTETCDNGEDCAVMVNGDDATFKRVKRSDRGIVLQPLNPAYDPLYFDNTEIDELPVRVLGVAIELRRPL